MEEFKYLRRLSSANIYSQKNICARDGMAKASFNKMQKILTGELKQRMKKRLENILVWTVVV